MKRCFQYVQADSSANLKRQLDERPVKNIAVPKNATRSAPSTEFGTVLILVVAHLAVLGTMPLLASELIDAPLEASDFDDALATAGRLEKETDRDAAFQRIAVAQAASENRTDAIRTLRQISNSSERYSTATRCFSTPWMGGDRSGHGGGTQADFDALIELIKTTVATESWDDVGGPGALDEFAGGVYVDAGGLLRKVVQVDSNQLALLRKSMPPGNANYFSDNNGQAGANHDATQSSPLRYVSLPRLEREILLRRIAGAPMDDAVSVLAGLRRVKYIFVYPETGDLVLAGPAGPWSTDGEGRIVAPETGLPVVRLDDLAALWRRERKQGPSPFGCSITPNQENLAKANAYLAEASRQPLKPGKRARHLWLGALRDQVGRQQIRVFGLDARTRAARVLVEADYRMKLVGMGLEEGVPGVESYLDSIRIRDGEAPPPMKVLRWWFTLNYRAIAATRERNAFEIRGQGAKVLSENELLTRQGRRVHTGLSDQRTQRFATSFTSHFDDLCAKYPVYADLRNVFDLAIVTALIESEGLADMAGWSGKALLNDALYRIGRADPPRQVDSVVNDRLIGKKYVVAGVSGGVSIDARPLVSRDAIQMDPYGSAFEKRGEMPTIPTGSAWWWDSAK